MTTRAAAILAATIGLCVLLAAIAHGGVYQVVASGSGNYPPIVFRVNRFTGDIQVCWRLDGIVDQLACWDQGGRLF